MTIENGTAPIFRVEVQDLSGNITTDKNLIVTCKVRWWKLMICMSMRYPQVSSNIIAILKVSMHTVKRILIVNMRKLFAPFSVCIFRFGLDVNVWCFNWFFAFYSLKTCPPLWCILWTALLLALGISLEILFYCKRSRININ